MVPPGSFKSCNARCGSLVASPAGDEGMEEADWLGEVFANAWDSELMIVAAAGDETSLHRNFPAVDPHALFVHTIGADTDSWEAASTFLRFVNCNNFGPRMDLVSASKNSCATGSVAFIAGAAALHAFAVLVETARSEPNRTGWHHAAVSALQPRKRGAGRVTWCEVDERTRRAAQIGLPVLAHSQNIGLEVPARRGRAIEEAGDLIRPIAEIPDARVPKAGVRRKGARASASAGPRAGGAGASGSARRCARARRRAAGTRTRGGCRPHPTRVGGRDARAARCSSASGARTRGRLRAGICVAGCSDAIEFVIDIVLARACGENTQDCSGTPGSSRQTSELRRNSMRHGSVTSG